VTVKTQREHDFVEMGFWFLDFPILMGVVLVRTAPTAFHNVVVDDSAWIKLTLGIPCASLEICRSMCNLGDKVGKAPIVPNDKSHNSEF
jgi:hypothetical protein